MQDNHQTLAKKYVFTAIEAHALIKQQINHTQNLRKKMYLTSEATSLLIKKKLKLMNIRDHLENQICSFDSDPFLSHILDRPSQLTLKQRSLISKVEPKDFPKIIIADMTWAMQYLQEINIDMFREIFAAQQQQKVVIQGLQSNLQRYEQRLRRLQENLQKKFNDIKNRRY